MYFLVFISVVKPLSLNAVANPNPDPMTNYFRIWIRFWII